MTVLQIRKDLSNPPTARWWDSPSVQHLHCRKDLKHPLTAVSGIFAFCAKPKSGRCIQSIEGTFGDKAPKLKARRSSSHSGENTVREVLDRRGEAKRASSSAAASSPNSRLPR